MTVTINGTTGIAGVDGSAATPAAQGADTNTGIFYGTDIVGVSTGGTERVRVDSSGNVGIGTSSPNKKFEVANGAVMAGSSGQVLVGRYDSNFPGTNTVGYFSLDTNNSDGNNGGLTIKTLSSGVLTERMRIDSSGNLLVGTAAAEGAGISIRPIGGTDPRIVINFTNTAVDVQKFLYNGTQVGRINCSTTATSYVTSSDYRLKENVKPMVGALDKISQLNPVTYTWKSNGSDGQGFIAHELQAVVPDCVSGEKDAMDEDGNPVYQGIDTSFLVATLTKAIQELSAKNDALEARLAALEEK